MINSDILIPKKPKSLGYIVIGEATTIKGLAAPFDEENTEEKLKIEYMKKPEEIVTFWKNNANTNQFGNKPIEDMVFE